MTCCYTSSSIRRRSRLTARDEGDKGWTWQAGDWAHQAKANEEKHADGCGAPPHPSRTRGPHKGGDPLRRPRTKARRSPSSTRSRPTPRAEHGQTPPTPLPGGTATPGAADTKARGGTPRERKDSIEESGGAGEQHDELQGGNHHTPLLTAGFRVRRVDDFADDSYNSCDRASAIHIPTG